MEEIAQIRLFSTTHTHVTDSYIDQSYLDVSYYCIPSANQAELGNLTITPEQIIDQIS